MSLGRDWFPSVFFGSAKRRCDAHPAVQRRRPSAVAELVIHTFHPFFAEYVRPPLGEQIVARQHGQREQDYRDQIPTLHTPSSGRPVAVAVLPSGAIGGFIAWRFDPKPGHGEIFLLAVPVVPRRHHIGRSLCEHALHLGAVGK